MTILCIQIHNFVHFSDKTLDYNLQFLFIAKVELGLWMAALLVIEVWQHG